MYRSKVQKDIRYHIKDKISVITSASPLFSPLISPKHHLPNVNHQSDPLDYSDVVATLFIFELLKVELHQQPPSRFGPKIEIKIRCQSVLNWDLFISLRP